MRDFTLDELKAIAADVLNNPKPTGNVWLDARWDEPQNRKPYYRYFYNLAAVLQPLTVVELGGWQGTSAAHFAFGCPKATVITIDHHTDPGDDKHKERMEDAVNRCPNLIYFQGWTVPELAESQKGKHALGDAPNALNIVKEILDGRKIDILFIDGWHQAREFQLDFAHYSLLVNKPGLIICDDILGTPNDRPEDDGPAIGGMRRTFEKFPGEKILIDGISPGYPQGQIKWQ